MTEKGTKALIFVYPAEYEHRQHLSRVIREGEKGFFGFFKKSFDNVIQKYRDNGYTIIWAIYEDPSKVASKSELVSLLKTCDQDVFLKMPLNYEEIVEWCRYSVGEFTKIILGILPNIPEEVIFSGYIYRQSVDNLKSLIAYTNGIYPKDDLGLVLVY